MQIVSERTQVEGERRTLEDLGVSFDECYTCQDGSCSAAVTERETGEEYNLYIRKYRQPLTGKNQFSVDGRQNSNTDDSSEFNRIFLEESELVEFLCQGFSGFKCF